MPVVEPSLVEEKKSKEESTAVKKKKRRRESEGCELETRLNSQEYLEMETAGTVSKDRDLETAGKLVKKRKVGKRKLGGDSDFNSVSENKSYDSNLAVDAELGKKKGKKKTEKDAIELGELGVEGFVIGEENGGSVCVSQYKTKLDKKKRKKEKIDNKDTMAKLDKKKRKKEKIHDKDTMELEEPDNVDIGEKVGQVVCEEKCSVTLDEGKQDDMSKGTEKKRKSKKQIKKSGNVAQDVGQNTLSVGDTQSGNKERKKSKDKIDAGEMGNEKMAQGKDKGKRVSFTDAVEVFGDGAGDEESDKGGDDEESDKGGDDEESDQDSDSKFVHGIRFTKEEDATLMEAMLNYLEMKQLREKGLVILRQRKKHPELKGCWTEIQKALPHRPTEAVYHRARVLLYRSEERKWTQEEYDTLRRFVAINGHNWIKLAEQLGKSEIHVKDTWRRIRRKNMARGRWTQNEYQNLFDMVNLDLRIKAHQQYDHGHRLMKQNISWEAIGDKLTTRSADTCCVKWYTQLTSPLVKQGVWADSDDYRLVEALQKVDAVCLEDVGWDNLLGHRSGEVCRQRWNQMVRYLGGHREKSFIEQVELLSRRYCPEMIDYVEGGEGEASDLPLASPSDPILDV